MTLHLSHEDCYAAVRAQDTRFDGIFFTAVATTGIYCRPTCRVKAPKAENCTFYPSAAEAEAHGYRPCLRCRPEMAPGYSEYQQTSELVRLAMAFFDEQPHGPRLVESCAADIGISVRHLDRVFKEAFGVSPLGYLTTKRLLLAKALLTDTTLNITEVGLSAGFGSLSRFNAAFREHYKLAPRDFRRSAAAGTTGTAETAGEGIRLKLAYRPPYDWNRMLAFFARRAIDGVEMISQDGAYRRSLSVRREGGRHVGWLELRPDARNNLVAVTLSPSLLPVIQTVLARVRRVFDLDLRPDQLPAGLLEGVRLPGCFDGFEMSVRAILGQQITVKAAHAIAGRIAGDLGTPIETPWPEIDRLFPEPADFVALGTAASEQLGRLGVIRSRSAAMVSLAQAQIAGDLDLERPTNPEHFRKSLERIKGIGPWTASYLAMRVMGWPDAFPVGDAGIRHALQGVLPEADGKRFAELAERYADAYRPWRSYLTLSLWHGAAE